MLARSASTPRGVDLEFVKEGTRVGDDHPAVLGGRQHHAAAWISSRKSRRNRALSRTARAVRGHDVADAFVNGRLWSPSSRRVFLDSRRWLCHPRVPPGGATAPRPAGIGISSSFAENSMNFFRDVL